MERATHGSPEPRKRAAFSWFNMRGKALSTAIVLAMLVLVHAFPVRSDDGPGVGESAFDSPVLSWKYPLGEDTPVPTGEITPGDLLLNGNMDQLGFYWRPPNHWVAGGWFEWFSTEPFNFPEFNDGFERGFYHSYPSSQRLQLFGDDYAAGLMQSVEVIPCAFYQFEAYGQSRPGSDDPPPVDVQSHMRVGVEPYGWMSGRSIDDYDPGLEPEAFPDTVLWSPEATHNFVFAPYRVTTEALSDTVTVILYAYPEVDLEGGVVWNDTIWDTASLVPAPFPSDTLLVDGPPEFDGLITNLRAMALPEVASIVWDTPVVASTQLLYRVLVPSTIISETQPLTHTFYMPLVADSLDRSVLTQHSPADPTPVFHHWVVLSGLPDVYAIDFMALSRRLDSKTCITSGSKLSHAATRQDGYKLDLSRP